MNSIQHLDWAPLGLRSILEEADFIGDCSHGVRFWEDSRHLLWMSACAGSCKIAKSEGSAFVLCAGHARELPVSSEPMSDEIEAVIYTLKQRLPRYLVKRALPRAVYRLGSALGVMSWTAASASLRQTAAVGSIFGIPQFVAAPAVGHDNTLDRSRGAS